MGRNPSFSKEGLNRGAWTEMEDRILKDYVRAHGEGKWSTVPLKSGLKRCGKSCRLRWLNYLRPDIKRGNISEDEEELIIRLHKLLGNRWSLIAGRLPGRTDNEIKNYWNTIAGKKVQGHPATASTSCRRPSNSSAAKHDNPKTSNEKPDNTVENAETDYEGRIEPLPGIDAEPVSTIGKDSEHGDFQMDDHYLSKFLGLKEEYTKEDDNLKISRQSSSLNSDEDLLISPELMLCESDLQSIASFLEEGELGSLQY